MRSIGLTVGVLGDDPVPVIGYTSASSASRSGAGAKRSLRPGEVGDPAVEDEDEDVEEADEKRRCEMLGRVDEGACRIPTWKAADVGVMSAAS